jgi:hypothetical protein
MFTYTVFHNTKYNSYIRCHVLLMKAIILDIISLNSFYQEMEDDIDVDINYIAIKITLKKFKALWVKTIVNCDHYS